MEVTNLAQLKRLVAEKRKFLILEHRRPECIGEKRIPVKVQTNGFYSSVVCEDGKRVGGTPPGKALWVDYGKASDWEFDQENCRLFAGEHTPENQVWCIRF